VVPTQPTVRVVMTLPDTPHDSDQLARMLEELNAGGAFSREWREACRAATIS